MTKPCYIDLNSHVMMQVGCSCRPISDHSNTELLLYTDYSVKA